MNNSINNIYHLVNNPFLLVEYIIEFYDNYENIDNDFLLSYFILPITMYEPSRMQLQYPKKDLGKFIIKDGKENKTIIIGLEKRFEQYKELTNIALQIGFTNKKLKLNDNLTIELINKKKQSKEITQNFSNELKCAKNLGKLFSKYEIQDIYKFFKVREI